MPTINGPATLPIQDPTSTTADQSTPIDIPTTATIMVAPDGKHYNVPASSYQIAINNNWRPVSPEETKQAADKEAKIESAHQELEEHPVSHTIGQFLDEATLGVKPYIENQGKTDEEKEIATKAEERYVKNNPVKSYAAKAAGFVAPLAIPGIGELGEGAEALIRGGGELGLKAAAEGIVAKEAETSIARKIGGVAAKYATEGALYSTPLAATQAAYGDPESAAETMLWGVGLSGALGAGVGTVAEGARGAGKAAVKLTDILGDKLLQKDASGLTAADYYAKNLYGLTDKSAQKLKDRGQFLNVLDTAQEEGLHTVALTRDYGTKVQELIDDAGNKIGDIRKKAQSLVENDTELQNLVPTPVSVAENLHKELIDQFPEINTANHHETLKVVNNIVDDFMAGGNDHDLDKIIEIRKNVLKNKGAFLKDSPQAQVYAATYSIITKMEKEAMQNIFAAGEMPEQFPTYLKELQRYQTGKALAENLNDFKGKGKISDIKSLFGLQNIGIAYLAALGHPVSAGLGIASKYAIKQFAANKFGLLGKSVGFLRNAADEPALGGYLAKAGKEAFDAHIESLPSILSGSKLIARSVNPIQHLIGDTTGLSKDQQYNKLTSSINRAVSDTTYTASKVGEHAGVFASTSYDLASLVVSKQLGALSYLQSQIPKNPNPVKPFQVDDWKPTKQQQQEFLNKVSVVVNPMSVWQKYQDNTITKADRDTLMAVYPKLYSQMVDKIMTTAYDPRSPKLSYNDRLKISTFTGKPLDPSLQNIAAYQQAVATPQQSGSTKSGKAPRSSKPKLDEGPSFQTVVQKLQYGRNKE